MTFDEAIIVTAVTEDNGVKWEYAWMAKNACALNGGYRSTSSQKLEENSAHKYDMLAGLCGDGKTLDYYFMIDNYYGNF